MNPDEMKGMRDEQSAQENEEYSFLNETVKNPPIDFQKIFMKIIAIAGAAILFGVIAALAFYVVLSWRNSTSPNPVTIPYRRRQYYRQWRTERGDRRIR